jgi:hypothetical protein
MSKCKVIEDRGCDVKYVVCEGTIDECKRWCAEHCEMMLGMVVSKDHETNGNGDYWSYSIVAVDND